MLCFTCYCHECDLSEDCTNTFNCHLSMEFTFLFESKRFIGTAQVMLGYLTFVLSAWYIWQWASDLWSLASSSCPPRGDNGWRFTAGFKLGFHYLLGDLSWPASSPAQPRIVSSSTRPLVLSSSPRRPSSPRPHVLCEHCVPFIPVSIYTIFCITWNSR